ncbi:hypothetical protein J7I94_06510 [Streptomyces sp. ISL-12]|uniref:hypothetical protein n=1 Tax=Streptomyces sp. ISL-12 TaxID=2819177 RepID=UPI001BEBE2C7|nr:hypothetical protein [Streptomyces sp. ISL-12]MBT2410210.1 hypothetical protein [Streptomyces sp. ISL-12]
MTNTEIRPRPRVRPAAEPDGDLASLRGDCARMAPHWPSAERASARPVPPSLIHGVTVPPASARLLEAMEEYGD